MAIAKMTADAIKARPSRRSRAKIEATTEDDIRRQMIEDGENPNEELSERDIISPWYIRKKLGMSQREFANTLGVFRLRRCGIGSRTEWRWTPQRSR